MLGEVESRLVAMADGKMQNADYIVLSICWVITRYHAGSSAKKKTSRVGDLHLRGITVSPVRLGISLQASGATETRRPRSFWERRDRRRRWW